jgi:FAD-dependent oxidoreductase domain-containing protein 1
MYDVVIIGGALHGSSAAYHLLSRDPGLKVCVVDRDMTYEHAASERSNAGVRILFSQEENLRMSQYGHQVYRNYETLMAVDGEPGHVDFYPYGYMFMANDEEEGRLMAINHEFQLSMGCDVHLLDAKGVKDRFPMMNVHDVVCAAYSPGDGWLDPHGALTGMRRKARSLGAEYREGEVVALEQEGKLLRHVVLKDGEKLSADWIINTTGAWSSEICAMIGIKIPVVPLHRTTFYFEPEDRLDPLPQFRDGQPCGFRSEGAGFISGFTDFERAGEFNWNVDHSEFENVIWPRIANRVPAFERLKLKNSWACHYAHNNFDGNMIIGPWPGQPENFLIATGFSGHGLQHAPAVGRALSELVLDGGFQRIDLTRLLCRRVVDDNPYPELGVKA